MKFKNHALKLTISVVILFVLIVLFFAFFDSILTGALYLLKLFAPFIIAYLISIIANPLADKLQKYLKLPRGITAVLVIVFIVGIAGGVIAAVVWRLASEIKSIYQQFPEIYESMVALIESIEESFADVYKALSPDLQKAFDTVVNNIESGLAGIINDNYRPVMQGAGNIAKSLPSIFISIIVFILALFFTVSNGHNIKDSIVKILPEKMVQGYLTVKKEIRKYLGGYVKAQLIIMAIAFVVILTGLTILKVPHAFLIAIGIALLDALPFFGSGAALLPWSVISFITSDIRMGIGLLIIYLAVVFTRQMIEPKIVSSKIGINPILTLMSMYLGFKIFSIGGMILGPVCLMLVVSLYKAGAFNSIIKCFKKICQLIKSEIKDLYNYISMK